MPPRDPRSNVCKLAARLLRREDGSTTVEYAVLLAWIVVACLAAIAALGPAVLAAFQKSAATVGTHGVP